MRSANDQMRLNLSVGALSCRRPAYLERAVTSLRAHIERDERDASVSWFCLDNTSSGKDREEIKGLNWDLLVLSKHNVGVGPGLNSLLSLVRSGYVLLLPDDWELGNAAGTQFLRESAIILQTDPRLAQVRLDAAPPLDFADKLRCDGPFIASGGKVNFFVLNPSVPWGSFTFTPSLCRTEAFQDVGPLSEDNPLRRKWAEVSYSQRLAGKYLAIKSPDMLVFKHIGELTCPGWPIYDSGAGNGSVSARPMESDSIRVAAIIPTYGAFDYARKAISTFLERTKDGTAILVDDASPGWNPDDWERWIDKGMQGRIFVHHFADRGGLTRSWNWGLRKAREFGAEYAVAANSDILFTSGWFDGVAARAECRLGPHWPADQRARAAELLYAGRRHALPAVPECRRRRIS